MSFRKDYLIYIGRFQPFHLGHKYVVEKGLSIGEKIIILCGSSNKKMDILNPWTYDERKIIINESFDNEVRERLIIDYVPDFADDSSWINYIKNKVNILTDNNKNIGLIGHYKDSSSYYMNMFLDWECIEVENFKDINATDVREILFQNKKDVRENLKNMLPEKILDYIIESANGIIGRMPVDRS
ncbi:MAG: bifunctional NMN adenylyltransferase/nudix hydrolase [Candidatus Midichloriaceae bacterium]|jgi:bifunctional NMN adenylyltransferase/nudix hydrolase